MNCWRVKTWCWKAKRNELPSKIASLELSLSEAANVLSTLPPETDTTELSDRLAQVRSKKQPETETKRLRLERDQFADRLRRDMKVLPFWTGTADQLETLRVCVSRRVRRALCETSRARSS